jgi:small multidrug resistance pump
MWLTLAGAILFELCGTLALRASDGFRKKIWIAPMVIGYLVSFTMLSVTLSLGMPVGVAYGVWSAAGVALIAVIARALFKEPLTLLMVAGIALIIAGVLTIELTGSAG